MNCFYEYISKTGYTGFRNQNLLRIDNQLRYMHKNCQELGHLSKTKQASILASWCTFAFVMIFICTPILIAISSDFKNTFKDLRIIMIPPSLAWISLVIVFIKLHRCATKHHQNVLNLSSNDTYKNIKNIKGRNSKHCS